MELVCFHCYIATLSRKEREYGVFLWRGRDSSSGTVQKKYHSSRFAINRS